MIFFIKFIFFVKILIYANAWHQTIDYNFKVNTQLIGNDRVKLFESVYSNRDYFQLLSSSQSNVFDTDQSSIFIGARNYLYQIRVPDLQIISNQTWTSSQMDTISCLNRSIINNKDECDNYIKVYLKINDNVFKICSTNALNPKCRFYGLKKSTYGQFWNSYIINETSGVGQAPLKAYESKYAYNFANNRLYAANSIDLNRFFTSINGLHDQDRITTNVDDNSWLNRAEFISTFKNEKRIFFIFNEDVTNLNDENRISRQSYKSSYIAHICLNDRGAPLNSLRNIWTTYLKSKLSCTHNPAINSAFSHESLSPTFKKSTTFYFDEIKSVSEVYKNENGKEYFYAVFSTSTNSITASAICKFDMEQIMDSFHGEYKFESNGNFDFGESYNRFKKSVPKPRPSQCPNELTYQHLVFSRKNFIMQKEISSDAIVVESSTSDRFVSIDVDFQSKDTLFVGTENGRILTFVLDKDQLIYSEQFELFNGTDLNINFSKVENNINKIPSQFFMPQIIETKSTQIKNLKFIAQKDADFFVILTQNKLISMPADFCEQKKSMEKCDQNLYPYCQWSAKHSKCFNYKLNADTIPVTLNSTKVSFTLLKLKKEIDLKNETNSSGYTEQIIRNENEINIKINIYLFILIVLFVAFLFIFTCFFLMLKLSSSLLELRHNETKFKLPMVTIFEKLKKREKPENRVFSSAQQPSPFELSSTISYTSTKSSVLSANKADHPESRYVYLKANPCVLDVNRLCIENDEEIDYFTTVHQPKFLSSKSTCSSVSSGSSVRSSLSRRENYLNILKIKDEDIQRKNSILSNTLSNSNRYYL